MQALVLGRHGTQFSCCRSPPRVRPLGALPPHPGLSLSVGMVFLPVHRPPATKPPFFLYGSSSHRGDNTHCLWSASASPSAECKLGILCFCFIKLCLTFLSRPIPCPPFDKWTGSADCKILHNAQLSLGLLYRHRLGRFYVVEKGITCRFKGCLSTHPPLACMSPIFALFLVFFVTGCQMAMLNQGTSPVRDGMLRSSPILKKIDPHKNSDPPLPLG